MTKTLSSDGWIGILGGLVVVIIGLSFVGAERAMFVGVGIAIVIVSVVLLTDDVAEPEAENEKKVE